MAYHPLYQGLWSSRHLDGAPFEEKAFFIYLFSNDHVRPSGIYRVKDAQIQAETELPARRIRAYLADLQARGRILRDEAWLFVVGYFDRQPKQPNLLNGVRADIDSCTSFPVLTAWGQRYPLYSQWSTDRQATVAQRSTDLSRHRAVQSSAVQSSTEQITTLSGSEPPDRACLRSQAKDILAFLNQQAHKSFRESDPNLKLIEARLASGMTPANLRGIVARKVRSWARDPKMAQFLRPATLFSATNAEQYLGERDPDA